MYKYIVIEGIHGSGKSTVAKELTQVLHEKGINVGYYHFPNEEEDLGKVIRKTLADQDLYKHREVLGLLYASACNAFHIKNSNIDKIYVLERHPVTTGLIFQKDMPWEIRLQNYKFGIEELQKHGVIFYVDIDKNVAWERLKKRNEELAKQGGVWKDKADDKFITEFEKMSDLYEKEMFPQLDKLGLAYRIVDNGGTLQETISGIELLLT